VIGGEDLLDIAEQAVRTARNLGADEAEVFATAVSEAEVELQKDDIHNASTAEEATFGIRLFRNHSEGFATVNDAARIQEACEEALSLAAVTPPDENNGLAPPQAVEPLGEAPDRKIMDLEISDLVDIAAGLLDRVRKRDGRIRVDSGGVSSSSVACAVATSTGIRLQDEAAYAGGSLFGMAVDGDEVGSFDYDGHTVRRAEELAPQLDAVVDRFAIKTLAALGAGSGESFRGTAVLSPEVVGSFVLQNLLAVLGGQAVRTGRSPLGDKVGKEIASGMVDLVDDVRLSWATASTAFDREGTPTSRFGIIEHGVLQGFLYDVYEGRAAGKASTGHARGGASSQPRIGTTNLVMTPGETPLPTLCTESRRTILVSRFSGSSNPVTGEFSGVVKGGFLISNGERRPVKETMIAGNLYDLLKSVSGVSREVRNINGSSVIPALRVEDISVTAG
jgi:PmbA protein